MSSAISKVDSKGRVSIPVGLRWKLRLVEGSFVRIVKRKNSLVLIPCLNKNILEYGQGCVKVSTGACGASRPGSNPGSGPFNFKVYIFDLLNTLGYKKNKKIRLSKKAEKLLQQLGKNKVVRILFTSAKRSEVEEGLEKLFDETVFSANKKNTKNLEKTIKRLEKKGYNRWEICYIGDDFCKDFLPAKRCGLNTLLLRWIL